MGNTPFEHSVRAGILAAKYSGMQVDGDILIKRSTSEEVRGLIKVSHKNRTQSLVPDHFANKMIGFDFYMTYYSYLNLLVLWDIDDAPDLEESDITKLGQRPAPERPGPKKRKIN